MFSPPGFGRNMPSRTRKSAEGAPSPLLGDHECSWSMVPHGIANDMFRYCGLSRRHQIVWLMSCHLIFVGAQDVQQITFLRPEPSSAYLLALRILTIHRTGRHSPEVVTSQSMNATE